jgi:hypothetical protein
MGLLSREGLLGASDLREEEVELPSIGGSVRVRSLPAAYSNQAMSEALEVSTDQRGRQTATVNTAKLEALQVLHGLVEPKLNSIEDAYTFAQQTGVAWRLVVNKIDEISGVDKATIEKTNATFRSGAPGEERPFVENGHSAVQGSDGSDLPVRSGVGVGDADRGDV